MIIAEQYIQEGIRIRKVYIQNLKEILKLEPEVIGRKDEFDKITKEMERVVNSDLNEVRKALDLDNKLLQIEKEIKSIQDKIRPYSD
jgi:hypothetical protein